jgi:hypothetical protein
MTYKYEKVEGMAVRKAVDAMLNGGVMLLHKIINWRALCIAQNITC